MPRPPLIGGLALLALAAGCSRPAPVVEASGSCADAFNAQVCTWARTQGDSVLAVGATIPLASIQGAPDNATMDWPPTAAAYLAMPASAHQRTGLTEFTYYWEAAGHQPPTFMTPHFDFHFYLIPTDQRAAITCADREKPAALPDGYILPDAPLSPEEAKMIGVDTLVGVCVPKMGMHALRGDEAASQELFRGTMVVGYYQGKAIFLEPMISRAMLNEKKSFDLPVPVIPGMTTAYPRTFRATWNDSTQAYQFTFSDFRA